MGRMEAFSDGVIAIMVLELKVPRLGHRLERPTPSAQAVKRVDGAASGPASFSARLTGGKDRGGGAGDAPNLE